MKKILMITTGGTIASIQTKDGLKPGLDGNQLLEFIPQLNNMCDIDVKSVFSIDSTNVYYKHWLILAEVIKEEYDN
jgi:L-asparaginase